MKNLLIVLLLVLMCGCSSNGTNITNDLDVLLSDTNKITSNHPNNSLEYYDYYLPSDMGEVSFEQESLVLKYLDNKIVVNININDIINNKYYPEQYLTNSSLLDQNKLVYSNGGKYLTIKDIERDYILNLYQNNEYYVIELITSDLTYITSSKSYVKDIVKHLFTIARSVDLDEDLIINNYSDKNVVDYKKKQIDLFDSTRPTSGNLSELLIGNAVVGNQINESIEGENENTQEENVNEENTEE